MSAVLAFILASLAACSASDDAQSSGDGDGDGDGDVGTSGGASGDGDSSGGLSGDGDTGGVAGDGDGDTGGLAATGGGTGGNGDGDTGGTMGDGDGDTPPGPTYTLSEASGIYTYSLNDFSMTIDPADGGRVTSFIVGGSETLVQSGGAAGAYGSVFWPSPQADWNAQGWPPPPEIDEDAYAAMSSGDELTLTSDDAASVGLTITKHFAPTHTPGGTAAIEVTYTMQNTSGSPVDVAGWEVSRVASGIAFFPTGPAGQTDNQDGLMVTTSGGHSWYEYNAGPLQDGDIPKIFADGSDGWLAWSTGTAVVIKSFPNVTQANFAPGEAEVEIYANPDGTYFEVEQQGPLETIAPGGSATWTVLWVGAVIPGGSDTTLGSTDLTTLVTTAL